MQPHCPFISRPNLTQGKRLERFGNQEWDDIWQKLQAGKVSHEEVWAGYRENLELALDDIELLLENVNAENVVISSDHGNALGEWFVYGHPPTMPLDCLRVVPWIETTATDRGTHEPETEYQTDVETDREEQLAALGYVYATVPRLRPGLTSAPVLALVGGTVLLAGVYVLAGRVDRPRVELAAAAGQVYALVGVVASLLYPFVDPVVGATVRSAIVSTLPLNLMSIGAAVLLPLVFVYFVVLYSAFRGPVRTEESYS